MKLATTLAGIICVAVAALLATGAAPPAKKESFSLSPLLDCTVMVEPGGGYGTGVAYRNGKRVFVWTDAHVVAGTRRPGKGGMKFAPVWIIQRDYPVHFKCLARVVRYSWRHDIAILESLATFPKGSADFCDRVCEPGEALWHVGSIGGRGGIGSVSQGVFAAANRLRLDGEANNDGLVYDQASVTCYGGSSGGGLFRKSDLKCVGLVTEFLLGGTMPTFGSFCFTPVRRMKEFCSANDCRWAMEPVKVPEDLGRVLVDDAPVPVPVLPFPREDK